MERAVDLVADRLLCQPPGECFPFIMQPKYKFVVCLKWHKTGPFISGRCLMAGRFEWAAERQVERWIYWGPDERWMNVLRGAMSGGNIDKCLEVSEEKCGHRNSLEALQGKFPLSLDWTVKEGEKRSVHATSLRIGLDPSVQFELDESTWRVTMSSVIK